jgi:hypothetical protein
MKGKVFNFGLVEKPNSVEKRGQKWVSWGDNNDYPSYLQDLAENSALHSSILKAKLDNILGEGLRSKSNPEVLRFANSDGESWDDIMLKISKDFLLYNGFALNIIHTNGRETIEVFHIDYANVRPGKKDEDDRITSYFYSTKWNNTRKYPPKEYESFSMVSESDSTIFCYSPYTSGREYFPIPDYSGGIPAINLGISIEKFHNYNLNSGMSPSLWVHLPQQLETEEELNDFYRNIQDNYSGIENAGRFILTTSDGVELKPDIQTIQTSVNDDYYSSIYELVKTNVLAAHRLTSGLLIGIKDASGLGSNKDEIITAHTHFLNTTIKPYQDQIISIIKRFIRINLGGLNLDLYIEPNKLFDEDGDLNV